MKTKNSDERCFQFFKSDSILGAITVSIIVFIQCAFAQTDSLPIDPHKPQQILLDGDIASALRANKECVDYYQKKTSKLKAGDAITGLDWLNICLVGYHLCAKAQIQALAGDTNEASKTLAEIDRFTEERATWFNSFLIQWPEIINTTKGFVYEKKGDIANAKNFYLMNPSAHSYARLAVMALSTGQTDEAEASAKEALTLDPTEATAISVLAGVLEKSGNTDEALRRYNIALNDMMDNSHKNNDFSPLVVAESARVKSAIDRLKTHPKSSP